MGQKLGQHFLQNDEVAEQIAQEVAPQAGETVIEIGPGKQALTEPLAQLCRAASADYIGIERDDALAQNVRDAGLSVVEGDAIEILPKIVESLGSAPYRVVGNIPYYITGKLLRVLSELSHKPERTVLMVQKEVAERLCAAAPQMNLLAGAVQFWALPKNLFAVLAKEFSPAPKVDSAVISLTPRSVPFSVSSKIYYAALKAIFKQPRKLLLNNLEEFFENKETAKNFLAELGIAEKTRGQNLAVEKIVEIAGRLPS